MEKGRFNWAILFPLLSILTITIVGGGIGIIFILLNELVVEEWAVVIAGMSLVVGVPLVATLLQRRMETD